MTERPWFDSHENLYKLAEWLRKERGWDYFKNNAIDMLETPWSWEREWRLASGQVDFTRLAARPLGLAPVLLRADEARCAWCDEPVGAIRVDDGVEWIPVSIDSSTGDYACDNCAGSAVTA